ncbi:U6 snRNA-associated Sm [Tubulinosema ratisbonensis]|uniref:U6 snRNA-associated Sm n=1 Tax=Tubulinosema ratisbonensis TaxID=291195 RepID=A0A437AI77_9MICR|nr:U6 snRNA-associated Sm [Tubulinosema ratisbonensis]
MIRNLYDRLLNKRVKIRCKDRRCYEGDLISYDENLNIVLDDAEQFKGEKRRFIGLMMLQGKFICQCDIISPSMNTN